MKKFYFVFLFLSLILLVGCSNILLADNSVLTIDTNSVQDVFVKSMNTEQPGVVRSKTDNGQVISTNYSNDLYSIDMYDPQTSTLVNYITTDNRIYDVKPASKGIFYTRNMVNDQNNIQINWSSFDKATERTVTTIADSPESMIYAFGQDKVVFINNSNELVFSDSLGTNNVYNLDFPVNLKEIVWSDKEGVGFFIGNEEGMNSSNLYQFFIDDENNLKVNMIEKDAVDMDFNPEKNKLIFLNQNNNKTFVNEVENLREVTLNTIMSDSNLERITYDKDNFIFTKKVTPGTRSTVWYYNREKDMASQITSPYGINSPVIVTANNEFVFSFGERTYQDVSATYQMTNFIANFVFENKN